MLKQNFGKNKINIFHHLSKIGINFHKIPEHFGVIQGMREEGTSIIVTTDINQLLHQFHQWST